MDKWLNEVARIGRMLAGNPDSVVVLSIILALGVIAFLVILPKAAGALKTVMATTPRSIAVFLLGVAVLLPAVVATNLYIVPGRGEHVAIVAPIACAVVALLAIVVPVGCFLLKGKYLGVLSSLVAGLVGMLIVMLLVKGVFDAFKSGGRIFTETGTRTEEVNKGIGK